MNSSTASHSSLFNAGNWQHEKSDTDVKTREGFFRRHLITPTKNATRYITDGIRTLCRRIQFSFIRICTPLFCCACLRKKERTDSNAGLQESVPRKKEDSTSKKPEHHEAEGKSEISHFLTSHDVALSSSQLQGAAAREDAEMPPEIFDLTSHNASPNIESGRLRNVRDKRPNRNRSKPDPDSGDKRHKQSLTRPLRKNISSAKKWLRTNLKSCTPHKKKPSPQNTPGFDRQGTSDQVMTRH